MEVTPEEEGQAVLLEEVDGTQYITIHRAAGESLGKGIPLFTLNGELISEGMVVDMINADVGTEYSTTAQYYEAEDLLPPDMSEEDQRLTAALVAVQIQQQQQEHQQRQKHLQASNNPGLSNVELQTLESVNIYSVDSMPGTNPNVFPSLPSYKHEEIDFKSEGDEMISTSSTKRSLPHKKRIPRKLKQAGKKTNSKKETNKVPEPPVEIVAEKQMPAFKCELCSSKFTSQLNFFEHLKVHYEPLKKETPVRTIQQPVVEENKVVEEFSESEDLMEGIRGVVEETGAQIDFETDDPLTEGNELNWPSTEEIEKLDNIARKTTNVNEKEGNSEKNTDIPKPPKKERKRSQKNREDHTCKFCKRYFNYKNSLIYHMRSHSGERPHQCEVCGKSFFAASALKVHKRLHSGDKPYKCEDCGRKFRQWGDLKYHSTSIHSELRQFQCEYCGKDFARKYSLIVHRRIHTGEKNYQCEYCNKTFRASSYLQNHRKIHTGEKPHPCTICGKPFRVRSDMKRHMQTHTREKPERTTNKNVTTKAKVVQAAKTTTATTTTTITSASRPKSIQDLVDELKLEVEPGSIGRYEAVNLVAPEENHESILPHESANLEYAPPANQQPVGRELETTIRNSDNFQYLFM